MRAKTSHLPPIQVAEPVVWQGGGLAVVCLSSARSSVSLSAGRPDLSRGSPPLHCLKLLKQHVRKSESQFQDKTEARLQRVADVVRFSLVSKDESVKGEISPPRLVLKYPLV